MDESSPCVFRDKPSALVVERKGTGDFLALSTSQSWAFRVDGCSVIAVTLGVRPPSEYTLCTVATDAEARELARKVASHFGAFDWVEVP